MSRDRIILRAVHQSFANKRNEKIIHPEKIHREIDNETAGLTCVAHLLNASKKMATINLPSFFVGGITSLCVENVDRYRLQDIDVYPYVSCP
jgi:hypothetical protein